MTVIYPQALINSRLTDVLNAIDAGGAAGSCLLYDAGGNLLSTLPLAFPCGNVAAGALTLTVPFTDPAAAGTGQPVSARIQDSTGSNVVTGLTVGTGLGFDIILSGATITAGQTVAITMATITGR